MTKLLLDVDEAIEVTSIGRSTLYRLIADGTIESVKVGARRLIPADALTAFVEALRDPERIRPDSQGDTSAPPGSNLIHNRTSAAVDRREREAEAALDQGQRRNG